MYYSLFQHSSKAAQNKSRILMVMFAILFTCMLIFHIYCDDNFLLNRNVRIFNFEKRSVNKKNVSEMKQTNNFLIKQKGCRIPAMFTFGPLVEPYLDKASPVTCDVRTQKTNTSKSLKIWKPALFHDEGNTLYVDQAALKYYGKGNLHCEYEEFFRSKPSNDSNEDYYDGDVVYKGAKKIVNTEKPTEIGEDVEFIRVQCVHKKKSPPAQEQKPVYEDFFAFAPLKRDVETRCEKYGDGGGDGDGKTGQSGDTISVMVVALDALSRLNFHRQMKLSSQYLKQKMKAIEMLGYNKVGDNTFPNFIPMFAGVSVDELKKKCWKNDNDYFDKCSFVWQKFQQRGYRTNFAEEAANIGVFHYIKKGFRHQPTDYYFRPFNTEAEKQIGHHKPANTALCVGARLNLAVLLDYAAKFGRKFSSKKYFGLFWSSSYTHDWFSLASEGDKAVLNFLRNVNKNNVLKNTALVFISDHGLRWGSFRETFQGHLEERLPMLWFVLPRWFQRKYRKAVNNLRENARKLTTPFDLYETLNDFANLTRIRDKVIDSRSPSPSRRRRQRQRQASLFLPVPESRTCSDAGIPKHFCACHNDVRAISKNDSTVVKAANQIVKHINSLVKKHSACSQLRLKSIVSASIERTSMSKKFSSNTSRNDFESNYTITVKTTPGNGLFEATVRYEPAQHLLLVIGSVSRLNMYGSQGKCVNDSLLRLYCYCRII